MIFSFVFFHLYNQNLRKFLVWSIRLQHLFIKNNKLGPIYVRVTLHFPEKCHEGPHGDLYRSTVTGSA